MILLSNAEYLDLRRNFLAEAEGVVRKKSLATYQSGFDNGYALGLSRNSKVAREQFIRDLRVAFLKKPSKLIARLLMSHRYHEQRSAL